MRDRKPKPQNTEFRFSKEVRGKAKINDNPIVADLDMLQKKHSNVLKTKGAVARLILAIKDDPTHFLDGSNPQNALLLKKLKDGKTGMIGVRREDTPENLIVHALKSSNKKEIERLVRRQMGRASLPTTLKNETGTGAKSHSSASGDIISQNSTKGETAQQGSKIEQAEAKQEVVKGEGWTIRDGGAAKTDYTIKTNLAPNVRDLSKITVDEITADLEYLAAKHPEIFDKPSDVFRLIREIKNDPTHFFTNNRLDYALIVKRLKNNKIGKLAIDKQSGEAKHATRVKDKDLKRLDRVSKEKSENAGIIQTFARPGSKLENRGLGYQDEAIISQNSAKEELNALSKSYDVEQFLKDRENILAKDTRYGKTRFSDARVEDNGGVGGWEYKRAPAGYDKNYKADFLTTKADVAKIRGGKINDEILTKLKQDLESSEHLGYEYKKTHKNNGADEYADEEFFKGAPVESKGGHSAAATIEEQRSANTGRDKNTIMYVNPHVGAGLAGGTLNAKDENGNFDAEKFAKGFIYGLFGSKVTAATLKKTNPKLYDQIVNIGKDKAGKEKISSFVNKLKQDELGKLLQKTVTNKDISTKTKIEIIEAAKGRYAQAIKNEQTKKAIEASAQKGRDMTPIGRENLNAEIVEYVWNSKKTIAVDKLDVKRAKELNFKHPQDVRRTIGADAVTHVINRHGKDSDLVKKSGQKPVTFEDIAKWEEYADNASISAVSKDKSGQEVVVSGKQINGYYVIVEEIKKKRNELAFKSMYFENGRLENNEFFRNLALGTD